jgi:hypothetical protein
MKSKFKFLIANLTLALCFTGCRTLSISINETNPPVFTFSAGQFAECCDHLAFLLVYEIPGGKQNPEWDPRQAIVIWKIGPKSGTDNSAAKLPHITYGKIPIGFDQEIPSV